MSTQLLAKNRPLSHDLRIMRQCLPRARDYLYMASSQRRRRPGSGQRNPPERLQHFAPCDVSTSHPAMSQLRTLRCPNFAPCDASTSHPAMPQLRTLRCLNFAPCDVSTSHPAMFQLRTLRCFRFAPCEVCKALVGSSPSACGFRLGAWARSDVR